MFLFLIILLFSVYGSPTSTSPMAVENRQGNLLNILILITKYLYWLQSVTTVSDEDLLETPKWRIIKRFLRSHLNSDKMVKTLPANSRLAKISTVI